MPHCAHEKAAHCNPQRVGQLHLQLCFANGLSLCLHFRLSMSLQLTPGQISELRAALGLSQAEFAQLLGVHHMTVSKWERPHRPPLAIPTPYQTALMHAFNLAVQTKKVEVQQQVKRFLCTCRNHLSEFP
jgi:DNA-binding XRE family transcriptional regulator